MKPVKQWFAIGEYDDETGREKHWYNRRYEYNGNRFILYAGDLAAYSEEENGGYEGPEFNIELSFAKEGMPMWYFPGKPNARYDIGWIGFIFWRWGVQLYVRGRIYA